MSDRVAFVLERFNSMLAGYGARLEARSLDDGVLRLRYEAPGSGECVSCVLRPDDLEQLIQEALAGCGVTAVRVDVE